jgi:FAD/FMN-containing dehydrogenase
MSSQGTGSFEAIRSALPPYLCLQNIAGFERMPGERVAYQEKDIRAIASRHGLSMNTSLGSISAEGLLRAATRPCGETDWRHRPQGGCLSLFFLTTLDRAPGFIDIFAELAGGSGLDAENTGCYIQPVVQNHACHVELMVPFSPGDAAGVERMHALEKKAVSALAEAGAFFSRPYGSAADIAFVRDPLNYELLRKTKAIFDPKRVLNSGKWGL